MCRVGARRVLFACTYPHRSTHSERARVRVHVREIDICEDTYTHNCVGADIKNVISHQDYVCVLDPF